VGARLGLIGRSAISSAVVWTRATKTPLVSPTFEASWAAGDDGVAPRFEDCLLAVVSAVRGERLNATATAVTPSCSD
jgi:hypothetical protein